MMVKEITGAALEMPDRTLKIDWDGNAWVSPSTGEKSAHPGDAMRQEIRHYCKEHNRDATRDEIEFMVEAMEYC